MKPQMTTESIDFDEPFLVEFSEEIPEEVESIDTRITRVIMRRQMMTEDNTSFLVLFQQPVPRSVADEGATKKTDVVQETTDDD